MVAPASQPVTTVRVPLLPLQIQFLDADEREVLYVGGFGAGKSRALCQKTVRACWRSGPGTVHGLFRKTRASLTRTTLRTLLFPDGGLPPVLPPGSYRHNEAKGIIDIHGSGSIMYAGCDQPSVIGSMNLVSANVDECVELDEDEWTMLLGRLRMRGGVRQINGATNPGSPAHFLHSRIVAANHPSRRCITAKTTDNVFLPDDFLESMSQLTGTRYQRYVLGLWTAFEGLVYGDVWDRAVHVRRTAHWCDPEAGDVAAAGGLVWIGDAEFLSAGRKGGELRERAIAEGWVIFKEFVTGVDNGYTDPAVLLKYGVTAEHDLVLVDEFYATRRLPDQIVKAAVGMDGGTYVADPSAAALIASMREAGLVVVPANNDIMGGIGRVMDRMKPREGKPPRILYSASASNTIMEKESYQWAESKSTDKTSKDKPVDKFNHAMDAERYVVNFMDGDRISPGVSTASMEPTRRSAPDPEDEVDPDLAAREADERFWG